jgi:hypothetical protein
MTCSKSVVVSYIKRDSNDITDTSYKFNKAEQ